MGMLEGFSIPRVMQAKNALILWFLSLKAFPSHSVFELRQVQVLESQSLHQLWSVGRLAFVGSQHVHYNVQKIWKTTF